MGDGVRESGEPSEEYYRALDEVRVKMSEYEYQMRLARWAADEGGISDMIELLILIG